MNQQKVAARVRVARGARWLDEHFPGWEGRINRFTLELANGEKCICGQLFAQDAVKANQAGLRFYSNGFQFAQANLFTEANSWIRVAKPEHFEKVKAELRANGDDSYLARGWSVAAYLGFGDGAVALSTSAKVSDKTEVTWGDLQEAWEDLLRVRQGT